MNSIDALKNFEEFKNGLRLKFYLSKIPADLRDEAKNLLGVHMWTLEPFTYACSEEKRKQILGYLSEYIAN